VSHFYDVVVLGGDMAGAACGALLAERGFRVLWAGGSTDERYAVGPYSLPWSPMPLLGLDGAVLKRVLGAMNLSSLIRRKVEAMHPAYQLLGPDLRIDVGDDLSRELAREAPDDQANVEAVAARLAEQSAAVDAMLAGDPMIPPDGFWDRREATRLGQKLPSLEGDPLAPLDEEHDLRPLFMAPAIFGADVVPSPLAVARLATLYRQTFRFDGGRRALTNLLLDRMKAHSGEVRPTLKPERIEIKRGKAVAVELAGEREPVGCGHLIAALPAAELLSLTASHDDKPPKRLVESAETFRPAARRYHLHFVAPLEVIPDALGKLAFSVVEPMEPLAGANALMLQLADGYGQHAVLSVEAHVPAEATDGDLAHLRDEIRAHLDQRFPFLERHLLLVTSPHDGLPPDAFETPLGSAKPASPRAPMDIVWGPREGAEPPVLGISGIPHASGFKNVLFASRQVLPHLGLEGELHAGWVAARHILRSEKKRDLLKSATLEGG
jgi:hypothetical protein